MQKRQKPTKSNPHLPKNWKDNISGKPLVPVARVLSRLEQKDYSQNSLRAIQSDIAGFIKWYEGKNHEALSFERIVPRDIAEFRNELQIDGRKPSSVNRKLISLRQLFALAADEGLIDKNPCIGIKRAAMQRLAPKALSQPEKRKLLREVAIRGKERDRVIIELMMGAGLRVSEVVNLRREDVHISDRKGHLVVHASKGNKTRDVPLSNHLRVMLRDYLNKSAEPTHVFTGQRGALRMIAINKLVDKYAIKAGLKLSPHILRHTFAYNFLKANPGEIVGLAQILGHSNINTTAIYSQNRLDDLQEKIDRITN